MPELSEQAQQAKTVALDAAKAGLARKLKESFADPEVRKLLAGDLGIDAKALEDDKAIAQMAIDWVDKGEFSLGGKKFTRDTLPSPLLKSQLPQPETLRRPAAIFSEEVDAVKAEQEQGGFFSKIGKVFSWLFNGGGGISGFLERIGELVSWIFNGFSQENAPAGLKAVFVKEAGDKIVSGFGQRMQQEAKTNADMGKTYTPERIKEMEDKARQGIASAASGEKTPPLTVDSLAAQLTDIKPVPGASAESSLAGLESALPKSFIKERMVNELAPQALDSLESKIIAQVATQREQLNTQPKPEPVNTKLKAKLDEWLADQKTPEGRAKIVSFAAAMGGPNLAQRKAMAQHITEASTEVALDEANKGKSAKDLAPLVAAAVEKRLTEKKAEIEAFNPKFQLIKEDKNFIQEAAAGVKAEFETMPAEKQAFLKKAQLAVNHARDAEPSAPMKNINFQRVEGYAQTLTPVVSKDDIRQLAEVKVQNGIKKVIDQEVKDSWAPGLTVEGVKIAGKAPNDAQSKLIAKFTADVIANVMVDTNISSEQKAAKIKEGIDAALHDANNQQQIAAVANSRGWEPNSYGPMRKPWKIDEKTITQVADTAFADTKAMLENKDFKQLPALLAPTSVEAPRLPYSAAPAAGRGTAATL